MTAKVLKFTGLKVAKTLKPMKKKARKLKLKTTQARSASGPVKSSDVPATKGMIVELQNKMNRQFAEAKLRTNAQFKGLDGRFAQIDERFSQIDGRFAQIDERFSQIDGRFAQIDERFSQIDGRFAQIDARFARVEQNFAEVKSEIQKIQADIQKVLAAVHEIGFRVEEQNARNMFVLDGHTNLHDRVEKLEKKIDSEA